jgi:hypothetical protein
MLATTTHTHRSFARRTWFRSLAVFAAGATMTAGLSGCNNALEGGTSGAALGALAGMGIGSLSGDMGKGAAAGAIGGAILGGILGDQNRRGGGY